jgi:hypothetical protein
MKNENVVAKALKLYFGDKLTRNNVTDAESAKSFVHKWLDEVEYGDNRLAVKFLASEVRKRIDKEIDYKQLSK